MTLIEELKTKFNYDDKTINALSKIIPALFQYYKKEYEYIIEEALKNTQIICCNSYQTISKIQKESKLTTLISENQSNINDKDGSYLSNIEVTYNELKNIYEVTKTDRKIVISHTYNLDSAKGLEVLIMNLCKLIKSYNNEYTIEGNTIIKRQGLSKEKIKIFYQDEKIILESQEKKATGLQIGLDIYDTEQIEEIILKDEYQTYQYNSIKSIAQIIKEHLQLNETIIKDEIEGTENFEQDNLYEQLIKLSDECLYLENEMIIYAYSREEKDSIQEQITNKMCNEACNIFIQYKRKQKEEKIKKSQNS